MRSTFGKFFYLPDFSRSSEGPVVKALFAVPFLLVQSWAAIVAYMAGAYTQNSLVCIAAFALATGLFHCRWTALGTAREGITFFGLVTTGVVSAAAVYLAFDTNPLVVALGWGVTGAFSLRFYSWFWGPPMVFEDRALGEAVTFICGPFYWAMVLVVAAIILIGSILTRIIGWRRPA